MPRGTQPQLSTPGGVRHNRREYPHTRRDAEIAEFYRAGFTSYEIADIVKLSRSRCCQILHENGVIARKWRNRDVTPKPWTTDRQRAEA